MKKLKVYDRLTDIDGRRFGNILLKHASFSITDPIFPGFKAPMLCVEISLGLCSCGRGKRQQ